MAVKKKAHVDKRLTSDYALRFRSREGETVQLRVGRFKEPGAHYNETYLGANLIVTDRSGTHVERFKGRCIRDTLLSRIPELNAMASNGADSEEFRQEIQDMIDHRTYLSGAYKDN